MSLLRYIVALSLSAFMAATASADQAKELRRPDVVFVPTPEAVVERMLDMAKLKKGDVLYDLGSGDGRIPIAAAKKYGVRAVGIDIDPVRVKEARENAEREGVAHLVRFENADLFEVDLREANVVTLYLLPDLNLRLRPKLLKELRPGSRIVSHQFDMGDWTPNQADTPAGRNVYLWTVTGKKIG